MELTTVGTMPMHSSMRMTRGKYEGKTFKREQPQVWVEQWVSKSHPKPKCWIALHISHLEMMAGSPVVVH